MEMKKSMEETLARIKNLKSQGKKVGEVVTILNKEGRTTATGKEWNHGNLSYIWYVKKKNSDTNSDKPKTEVKPKSEVKPDADVKSRIEKAKQSDLKKPERQPDPPPRDTFMLPPAPVTITLSINTTADIIPGFLNEILGAFAAIRGK